MKAFKIASNLGEWEREMVPVNSKISENVSRRNNVQILTGFSNHLCLENRRQLYKKLEGSKDSELP